MVGKIGKKAPVLKARFRVVCGQTIALGPGKIELLAQVAKTGSLNKAAQDLDMSYMRAWQLVRTMNNCFREPLVQLARGGSAHGGATLTPTGQTALNLYEKLEADSLTATRKTRAKIDRLLRGLTSVRP